MLRQEFYPTTPSDLPNTYPTITATETDDDGTPLLHQSAAAPKSHAPPLKTHQPTRIPAPCPSRTLELPNFDSLNIGDTEPTFDEAADDEAEGEQTSSLLQIPSTTDEHKFAPELQRSAIAEAIKDIPDIGTVTETDRESFIATIPKPHDLLLKQHFGKQTPTHKTIPTFIGETCFRHIIFHTLKSGFIDPHSLDQFLAASPIIHQAHQLIVDYTNVDFRPLTTHWNDGNWAKLTTFDEHRIRMMTACAIHYNGDIPSVMRYIGGPFTDAHRDTDAILDNCKDFLDPTTYTDLERIYKIGVPSVCNGRTTEANFRTYLRYGNHKSVDSDPKVTTKSILKDFRPGFLATFDKRLRWHIPNMHCCPLSMQNVGHPTKKPRPAFDASCHIDPNSYTINDWTSKNDEPPMTFQTAWLDTLTWYYRLRATYPDEEIYPQDDDISMAHRRCNYHPNMVAMHSFQYDNRLHMYGRMTFGDTTSCPTFDVISRAREQAAKHFWNDPDIVEKAKHHLPKLNIIENKTPKHKRNFARANFDSKITSVIRTDGTREPPPFKHHIDDCLYGDIMKYVYRGLAASKTGLYAILGEPDARQPDTFSDEKLATDMEHTRRGLGKLIDLRRLIIALPWDRRILIADQLIKHIYSTHISILTALSIHGSLVSICEIAKWGKPYLYCLQNIISRAMQSAHRSLRVKLRMKKLRSQYTAVLSPRLIKRLEPLVHRHIARDLFTHKVRIPVTHQLSTHLHALAAYLRDPSNTWESPIGHLIPRDPFVDIKSDASEEGIGFHCEKLQIYGITILTEATHRRCYLESGNPHKVHINQLELIGSILSYMALATLLDDPSIHPDPDIRELIVNAPPSPQVSQGEDNKVSCAWSGTLASKSLSGQMLLRIQASLIRDNDILQIPYWLSSKENWFADFLSRPPKPSEQTPNSLKNFFTQIFHQTPLTKSWIHFQPTPAILSAIQSSLSNNVKEVLVKIPKPYGRFVPAESTASCYSKL